MRAIILDTETTGKNEPEAIEIAWIELSERPFDFQSIKSFEQRYKPSKPIELGAMANTHHITDADVANCPPSSDFKFPDGVDYLIGHNVDYDWKVIGCPNVKRICTLALSRMRFPDLDSHTLSAMVYFFEKEKAKGLLTNAHSAYHDVKNTHLILDSILFKNTILNETITWEDVWILSEKARIPTTISFGKHKGMAIKDLPIDYVAWLLRQPELDEYLEKALRNR